MWYFAWILGLAFACAAAILNALWYELGHDDTVSREPRQRHIP
jgi:cyd operon protein YbgT